MLVGPAMAGKSSIMKILRQSYINLFEKGLNNPDFTLIEYCILNPKSISMEELYGNPDIIIFIDEIHNMCKHLIQIKDNGLFLMVLLTLFGLKI